MDVLSTVSFYCVQYITIPLLLVVIQNSFQKIPILPHGKNPFTWPRLSTHANNTLFMHYLHCMHTMQIVTNVILK